MYNFTATSSSDFFSKYDSTINRFVASGTSIYEDDSSGKKLLDYTSTYNMTGYGGANSVSLSMSPIDSFSRVACYQTSKATIIMMYATTPTVSIIGFFENDDGSIYQIYCRGSQTSPTVYSDSTSTTMSYTLSSTSSNNMTAVCHFVAHGSIGENSAINHAYFAPIRQYTDIGIINVDDTDYFSTGYWLTEAD